jgi:spermidine/putrescine-binding protein
MLAGAGLAAPAIVLRAGSASSAGAVNITAYDGFVPQAVQTQFEAATGTQVRVRLAASQALELIPTGNEADSIGVPKSAGF